MNQNKNGSKIIRGINYTTSGDNQVIVVQKNGVIRAKPLKKTKSGQNKNET